MTGKLLGIIKGLIVPVSLLLVWEAAMAFNQQEMQLLVPPSSIWSAFVESLVDGSLIHATWLTLQAAMIGLGVGGGAGVAVGILFGLYPKLARLTEVPYEFFRPIPSVALVPLSLVIFGFGLEMEVAIVAFACFWPASIYAAAATKELEPRLLEVGRILELSFAKRVGSIVLPAALPRIFIGLRIGATVAMVVAVTVEVTANPSGLGYQMVLAQQTLRPDVAFAYLMTIAVVGWIINFGLLAFQNSVFPAAPRSSRENTNGK